MDRIPAGSVDMVLADLPYGTTQCKWDTVLPLDRLWATYKRVCKSNAAIVLTASQPFTSALGFSNIKQLRYSWIWIKKKPVGHLNVKRRPMAGFEDVLVFGEGNLTYNPQGVEESDHVVKRTYRGKGKDCYGVAGLENKQTGTGYPRGLITFGHDKGSHHPTQKPVPLMEYFVKTYTNPNELILDNCMGSGTTGVACMNLGRRFIGCDNDKEHGYFEIATKRIREAYLAQNH